MLTKEKIEAITGETCPMKQDQIDALNSLIHDFWRGMAKEMASTIANVLDKRP